MSVPSTGVAIRFRHRLRRLTITCTIERCWTARWSQTLRRCARLNACVCVWHFFATAASVGFRARLCSDSSSTTLSASQARCADSMAYLRQPRRRDTRVFAVQDVRHCRLSERLRRVNQQVVIPRRAHRKREPNVCCVLCRHNTVGFIIGCSRRFAWLRLASR